MYNLGKLYLWEIKTREREREKLYHKSRLEQDRDKPWDEPESVALRKTQQPFAGGACLAPSHKDLSEEDTGC